MLRLQKSVAGWLAAVAAAGSLLTTEVARADCPTGTAESDPAMADLLPSLDQAIALGTDPCSSLFAPPPAAGAQQIASIGGPGARITTIPIVFQNAQGAVRLQLYRVQSADGTVRYVEPGGRTYQSFANWQKENQLPPGQVTFPASGNIPGPGCAAPLATLDTPSNGLMSKIGRGVDVAAGVAMVGVAVAATVGTGGADVVVAGLGLAAYAGVRSVLRLSDRASHEQTINPIASPEARGDELNLAMTVVGLGAAGAAVRGASGLARGLGVASLGLGAAGTADMGIQTVTNWQNLTNAQRATAVSQLLFYGALTAIGAKQAFQAPEPVVAAPKNPVEEVAPRAIDPAAEPRAPPEQVAETETPGRTSARGPARLGVPPKDATLPVDDGISALREPATTRKVTWTRPAEDTPLFVKGKPSPEDVRQGPLGDCYNLATLADVAKTDPELLEQHIMQVGVAANGDKIYGAIFYVPTTQVKTVARFERAGADVIDPGTGKAYTPVWALVTDRQPVASDGTLISASPAIPGKGNVGWAVLSEKALAVKHGDKTGYRTITNGGYAAKVMEELTGRASEKFDLTRAVKLDADKALADSQFAQIKGAADSGKMVALGSWDTPAVRRRLARFPQLDEHGNPDTYFDPKKFDFADGAGNAASTGTASTTATDSRLGAGWVGNHEYSVLKVYVDKNGVKMVQLRNPWGDIRPPEFSDGKATEDGIINIPWYRARILFGDVAIGGRSTATRQPLQITQPTLPAGATALPIGVPASAVASQGR